MPWTFVDPAQTIASDGSRSIPLNQPTEDSRWLMGQIAGGLVIGPYVPPAPEAPSYTTDQLQAMLIQKGIIPPPSSTPAKVV